MKADGTLDQIQQQWLADKTNAPFLVANRVGDRRRSPENSPTACPGAATRPRPERDRGSKILPPLKAEGARGVTIAWPAPWSSSG